MKEIAAIPVFTVTTVEESKTFFSLVFGILSMVLSQLMGSMCKLAFLTIRARTLFKKLFTKFRLLLDPLSTSWRWGKVGTKCPGGRHFRIIIWRSCLVHRLVHLWIIYLIKSSNQTFDSPIFWQFAHSFSFLLTIVCF